MSSKNKDMQPYWRPDFRDPSTLPDIKVVRTDFLVNIVSVVILAVIAVFLLQREYRSFALKSRIQDIENEIRLSEPDDRIYIKQSEQFREAGQHILEMNSFYDVPFYAHELMMELAQLKREELLFTKVSLDESVVGGKKAPKGAAKGKSVAKEIEYEIRIDGEVHKDDLRVLSVFRDSLRESDYFKVDGFETRISEDIGVISAETDLFPYVLTIRLAPEQKSSKAKEAKG